MPAPDDALADLLQRTAQGEQETFASLYDATSRRVFGLALRILGDRDLAEEAALEAYTVVWRQAARYDPARGSALTWILTVARSKAIDLLRSRMRRGGRERALDIATCVPNPTPGPEAASARSEEMHLVREALAALPLEQREAIETTYFGGLTHAEVAVALGQPLGTVKTRIRTGLSSLRRMLAEV